MANKKRTYIELIIPDEYRGKINGSHIRWNDNINNYIYIKYNDNLYPILIKNVDVANQCVIFEYHNKQLSITMIQLNNKIKEQQKNGVCVAGKLLYLIEDNVLLGNTGYNALLNFKYKIGQHFVSDKIDYIITGISTKTDQYRNRKFYEIYCNKCGWNGEIREESINKHQCPCCSKEIVVHGINDIATTDPWAIDYFLNPKDAETFHNTSDTYVDMKCPICGQVYNKNIRLFFTNIHHLNCPCSKTYSSYPERYVFNLLKILNIQNVIAQASKKDACWISSYRYDFYLPDLSCIIETHGQQHYIDSFIKMGGKTCLEEQKNDEDKKILAMNNVKHFITLNCRYSKMDWIKKSVMKSSLPILLNFKESDIDWNYCDYLSRSDLLEDICKMYMSNIEITTKEIAECFGLKDNTVKNYLKRGKEFGLCDYDAYSIREKLNQHKIDSIIFIYKNGKIIRACTSIVEVNKYSDELFGITVSVHKIDNAIKKHSPINECYVIRNKSINTYSKYINYLCDWMY